MTSAGFLRLRAMVLVSLALVGCSNNDAPDEPIGTSRAALNGVNQWVACSYGQVIDSFQGVNVKCDQPNGSGTYQCVEYANRFDAVTKGAPALGGNATDLCGSAAHTAGFTVYDPGGTWGHASAGATPKVGDLLVWGGGSQGFGHVAVVTSPGANNIEYVQQNWGWFQGGAWGQASVSQTPWSGSFFGATGAGGAGHYAKCWIHYGAAAPPPPPKPVGHLDSADCSGVVGWADDPNTRPTTIPVHVYFNGPAGAPNVTEIPLVANIDRSDLCSALGSCNHGFELAWPRALFDGQPHDVHAYGITATAGASNAELSSSPKTAKCAVLKPPAGAVKRWITDSNSFAAWHFNAFLEVAPFADADLAAMPKGSNLGATPECVQANDGTPEVWIIDQGYRRHVIDEPSYAAWHLTATMTAAAKVYANPKGPDWPGRPDLAKASAPEVYVFDVPVAPPTTASAGTGATSATVTGTGAGGAGGGATGAGGGSGGGTGSNRPTGTCACSLVGDADSSPYGWLVFAALAPFVRRRARRGA